VPKVVPITAFMTPAAARRYRRVVVSKALVQRKTGQVLDWMIEQQGMIPLAALVEKFWPDSINGPENARATIRRIRAYLAQQDQDPELVLPHHRGVWIETIITYGYVVHREAV
jgi:hypothetical protein